MTEIPQDPAHKPDTASTESAGEPTETVAEPTETVAEPTGSTGEPTGGTEDATAFAAPGPPPPPPPPPGYGQPAYGQPAYGQPAYGQPAYGQPAYPAGYGPGPVDPQAKSKIAAGLLGVFLGGFGVHRFYLGYTRIGVIQIVVTVLTCGIGSLWGFVEGILYLVGASGYTTDAQGRPLRD